MTGMTPHKLVEVYLSIKILTVLAGDLVFADNVYVSCNGTIEKID